MSSMDRSKGAPASSQNRILDAVNRPMPAYNLDDFAFPTFVPRTLNLANLTQDVRTWRELSDYVRANIKVLPPYTLERTLSLQADYSQAGPAQRTSIPAMIPTISHVPIRGGDKGRGGSTHHGGSTHRGGPTHRGGSTHLGAWAHRGIPAVTPTSTNMNVPGAAQSQGLAQIAIGPREFPSDGKEVIPAKASVAPGVPREFPSQASRKDAIPAKASALPGTPRAPKLSAQPAIPTRGPPKQTVVKTATEATFEWAKTATAKTTNGAPQRMQKQAPTSAAKGEPSLKSTSATANTMETAKTLKSAQEGHGVEKTKMKPEGKKPVPMGELIDLSIPPGTKSLVTLPQMLHHGMRHSHTAPSQNNQMMPALAAIPALVPVKKSDHQSFKDSPNPAPAPMPPHLQILARAVRPPPPTRTISRHSASTRSRSPSYSRSPSPEKPKAPKPVEPRQAGRYYLVRVNDKPDYVWVPGAQRGDPIPPHLVPFHSS